MHRDLSSYACHTRKHLCTERITSDSLMFCHQRLSIANICSLYTYFENCHGRVRVKFSRFSGVFDCLDIINKNKIKQVKMNFFGRHLVRIFNSEVVNNSHVCSLGRNYSFKSAFALETFYPKSSLKLFTAILL